MAVVLELLLPCEQRGWTPHIRLPPGTKVFWGMFPFKHQYHPSSHQLKHNIFGFFFMFVTEPAQNFCQCCVYWYVLLCILGIYFMELSECLPWYTRCGSCANEHLFNRIRISHTLTSVWKTENKWVGCMLQCIKTSAVYSQTQGFNAIQKCAVCFISSELSSGTLLTKVKKHNYLGNMQILL